MKIETEKLHLKAAQSDPFQIPELLPKGDGNQHKPQCRENSEQGGEVPEEGSHGFSPGRTRHCPCECQGCYTSQCTKTQYEIA